MKREFRREFNKIADKLFNINKKARKKMDVDTVIFSNYLIGRIEHELG